MKYLDINSQPQTVEVLDSNIGQPGVVRDIWCQAPRRDWFDNWVPK